MWCTALSDQCAADGYRALPLLGLPAQHGGILTTWGTVPRETFHWLSGTPKAFKSSASCTRYFCADCGAHLALLTSLSPDTLDVTVATLDEPEQVPADRHIWVGSRLPWLTVDPQLPEERQEEID